MEETTFKSGKNSEKTLKNSSGPVSLSLSPKKVQTYKWGEEWRLVLDRAVRRD